MTTYLGEIRLFAFSQIPKGWLPCNGQSLAVGLNEGLFSLIGTTYGGDGITTFNLPNLQGRTPVHAGGSYQRGQAGGSETVLLTPGQTPAHTHYFSVAGGKGTTSVSADTNISGKVYLANTPDVPQVSNEAMAPYVSSLSAKATRLHCNSINPAGKTQPHENRMPYLPVLFCIAVTGILPPKQQQIQ